jgi:signal peptidase I
MYPTLQPGDRILIYHYEYTPKRDDIVILHITKEDYPLVLTSMFNEYDSHGRLIKVNEDIYFVKRVKAIAGDLIEFEPDFDQYYIKVNGDTILTPSGERYYVKLNQKTIMEENLDQGVLKEGLFMTFGDNPNGFTYIDPDTNDEVSIPGSFDSRSFGAVDENDIVGKVIFKLWPFGGLT